MATILNSEGYNESERGKTSYPKIPSCDKNPEQLGEGTRNKEECAWNKPFVPTGFHYLRGTVEKGYIIVDIRGNEFEWLSIDGIDVTYVRRYDKDQQFMDVPDEEYPIGITAATEKGIVERAGGLYIARYFAGVPENQTTIDGVSSETSDVLGIPVSKKDATPWTNIGYRTANDNARAYCNNPELASGLLTGRAWDTMDISQIQGTQNGLLVWTYETYEWNSSGRVLRGGNYGHGDGYPGPFRINLGGVGFTDRYIGFRVALYIKKQ